MTNLFDFATKELSQDAFIMWLASNYNEPKDLALRDSALSFISFLTDNKIDKKTLENSIIKISSQVNHMDVSIDIYKDKGSKIHDVIVVEDKVGSSEHRQLKAYNDAIEGWSNIGTVYKVFYKTRKITDNDRKGIKEADKDTKTGEWRLYDTEKIWKFFKDQDKSNSQVLNDYVDYIKGIKEALVQRYGADFDSLDEFFSKRYGISIEGYAANRMLNKAKELLRFTIKPMQEVISESGIGSEEKLRSLFMENENMSPEDYRKKWAQWIKG